MLPYIPSRSAIARFIIHSDAHIVFTPLYTSFGVVLLIYCFHLYLYCTVYVRELDSLDPHI